VNAQPVLWDRTCAARRQGTFVCLGSFGGAQADGRKAIVKIAIAADHAGFELKERVKALLLELNYNVFDLGTRNTEPVDYPDYAEVVALAVRDGKADRGILVCGSGVGASVAANKIPGVRAGLCHDHYSAHQGVEHDDMNVLVMGGRVIGESVALELVRAFLDSKYTGEDRHQQRLAKVRAIEGRYGAKGNAQ
jgi:RpiB/LacA/LacB family sugar-phosphate isomerase